jgi:phospholipid/cholesterol/gamma-HCH transport system permease protein
MTDSFASGSSPNLPLANPPGAQDRPANLPRRLLAALGVAARRQTRFVLLLAALALGVFREALRPLTWRRTVRRELRRALRQSVSGALPTVIVTAALIGVALVHQALFWLGRAGQENLIGSVLVSGLMRGIGPALVGLILLGRSGMHALAEIGALKVGGQVSALEAQGLDPFLMLLFPRALAFAAASFTLTVLFIATALLTGFIANNVLQGSTVGFLSFLNLMLRAMVLGDVIVFPLKTLGIGLLIALAAGLTALEAHSRESAADLLPRGFVRGVLVVVFVNAMLTVAI